MRPTFTVPLIAGPAAVKVIVVALTQVTAPMVSSGELDVIVAPFTKPAPVRVIVAAVAPAMTDAGEAAVVDRVGAVPTVTPVNVYEPPVVLVTVTAAEVAVAVAETDSVIKLGVTEVTVADRPLVLGNDTVAPDKKPEPAT